MDIVATGLGAEEAGDFVVCPAFHHPPSALSIPKPFVHVSALLAEIAVDRNVSPVEGSLTETDLDKPAM